MAQPNPAVSETEQRGAAEGSQAVGPQPHPTSPFVPNAERRAATVEQGRLDAAVAGEAPWQRWGTYLSERAWGTVREDYSADGDA
ncbi:MAG: hypothetical protein ACH36H_13015, partial [Candidatus Nanopelagicales bacterium]